MRRLILLFLLSASACRMAPTVDKAEVRGSVVAADGKVGVTCQIEINAFPPLFVPESVEAKTGAEFRHALLTSGKMERMYAAVRCDGYATSVSRLFELEAGSKVDLGKVVVTREEPGGRSPS